MLNNNISAVTSYDDPIFKEIDRFIEDTQHIADAVAPINPTLPPDDEWRQSEYDWMDEDAQTRKKE